MILRRRILLGAAALLTTARVAANEPAELDKRAYAQTIEWFKSLWQPVRELSIELDKVRLANYLDEISRSFGEMITEKREIATLLKSVQSEAGAQRLALIVDKLTRSVRTALQQIDEFSGRLTGVYQRRGREVVGALRVALIERKGWLGELTSSPMSSNGFNLNDDERKHFAEEAASSADALDAAFGELSKLIGYTKST